MATLIPTYAAILLVITLLLLIGGVIAALVLVVPLVQNQNNCCHTGVLSSDSIAATTTVADTVVVTERGGITDWTTDADRVDKTRRDALFAPTAALTAGSASTSAFTGNGVPRGVGSKPAPFIQTTASRRAGSYVVVMHRSSTANLRDAVCSRHAVVSATTADDSTTVRGHTYSNAFVGFAVNRLSKAALDRLRLDPAVASIHEDGIVTAAALNLHATADCSCTGSSPPVPVPPVVPNSQVVGWQVGRVGANRSSFTVGDGSSVVNADVYILDTGLPNHPDITSVVSAVTFVPGATSPADGNGHGTHVAGIIAAADNRVGVVGVAPSVRLHIVQVLDSSGSGAFSTIVAGVDYVIAQKQANPAVPIVANMSLGAQVGTTAYNVLDLAVSQAISAGITFCVAAGNSSADARYFSPAHVTTAIAIGSIGTGNRFSSFSNYGPPVVLLGPGEDVNSTWLSGTYKLLSGTSMATPAAAAIAAAYLSENRSATPAQVKSALISAAAAAGGLSPPATGVPASTGQRCAWMAAF